jgi:hypothetical protein
VEADMGVLVQVEPETRRWEAEVEVVAVVALEEVDHRVAGVRNQNSPYAASA